MVVESKTQLSTEVSRSSHSEVTAFTNGNDANDGNSSGGEEIENVHRLVQDENAKTILLNVPLEDQPAPVPPTKTTSQTFTSSKPPKRPAASPRPGQTSAAGVEGSRRKLSSKVMSGSSARVRSASVGRDKHSDTQARYWAFLFENLRRAVDDLYRTCETDESIPAVKEVILVFENYVRDFRNLANWLKLNREYENTPPPQRPTSLAWEVRKTPPASGSALARLTPTSALVAQRLFMATPAKRVLDFDDKKDDKLITDVTQVIKEVTPSDEKEVVDKSKDDAVIVDVKQGISHQEPADAKVAASDPQAQPDSQEEVLEANPACQVTKVVVAKASCDTHPRVDAQKGSIISEPKSESQKPSTSPKSSKPSSEGHSQSTAIISSKAKDTLTSKTVKTSVRPSSTPNTVTTRPSRPAGVLSGPKMTKAPVPSSPSLAKTKSRSSSNLSSSKENSAPLTKATKTSDMRQNRISLVARQSRVATVNNAQSSTASGSRLMTRSATSAALPTKSRVVAFGRGIIVNNPALKAISAKPDQGSRPSSIATVQTSAAPPSSSRPGNSIPFGSTSSISSSSSNRSWADTVKGIRPAAPRSVENLSTETFANTSKPEVEAATSAVQPDDEMGWETVKPRTRSKFSPLNLSKQDRLSNVKVKEKKGSLHVRHSARGRFDAPSSAMSLPSIALLSGAEDRPRRKSDQLSAGLSPEKRRALKQVNSTSGVIRHDRSNLERISGSDSSSQSSEENLSKVGHQVKSKHKKRDVKSAPKPDPEIAKSPLPSQDEDGASDAMDSEIARRDVAIALAEEEERNLAREIQETEKSEMPDLDTDGDQASTSEDLELDRKTPLTSGQVTPQNKTYPSSLFEGLSWADQIDLEEQLQESRYPGRAIQIHEKLSSPARKREPHETLRHYQEKQKNAKLRRERFQEEKAQKLLALNARIEEVISQKNQLISEQRDMMNLKMARAEIKRQEHIDGIRKKARVEDAKLKEIAFINELQAQNARIDALAQTQTADVRFEERLAELAEERHKKQEQREAKEARAEERRKAMEEKRKRDMEALKEKIRSREERIQEELELARKERQEAAREKARGREEKLSTVRAAERDMKEELHEKIIHKHQEAAKRHKEKLELVRQKAIELSVQRCDDEALPRLNPYNPKKKCSLCQVIINNEVHLQSHLRGRVHAEKVSQANDGRKLSREELRSCNVKYILDAEADDRDPKVVQAKERQKSLKKKAKKLKARMLARAVEYELSLEKTPPLKSDSPNRAKIGKSLRDIEKVFSSQGKGAWPNNAVSAVDRALGELLRIFEKNNSEDKTAFHVLGGFGMLSKLFVLLAEQRQSCVIPLKTITLCCKTWSRACSGHRENTEYILKNNHLTTLIDILIDRLIILIPDLPSEDLGVPPPQDPQIDPVAKSILSLLSNALEDLRVYLREEGRTVEQSKPHDVSVRAQDQIGYIVAVGIVDKLAAYFHSVQNSMEGNPEIGNFLLASLNFLSSLTGTVEALTNTPSDPTQLWNALQVTDLAGIVSMLYGILLHKGSSSRDTNSPPTKLPDHTMSVTFAALQLMHRMVRQRLAMVQEVLSQECISLEFRHIASFLIWHCQTHHVTDLLHLSIVLVGYFAAKNKDNQVIVQSGQQPTVLQQLCNLPFVYFSQPDLKRILFPTLFACCYQNNENTEILAEEMSWKLIEEFLQGPDGTQHLVEIVLS